MKWGSRRCCDAADEHQPWIIERNVRRPIETIEVNSQLYSSMGELVQNLSDSVEDTKAYKENIADLAKNLSSLNTVYALHAQRQGQISPEVLSDEQINHGRS